jgi:hypothetical protein
VSWLVEKSAEILAKKTSRRGFLIRTAVAGTAVVVSPLQYILRPVTAYAALCGCANTDCDCGSACCDGYTAFCCEVNDGHNVCPAGSFPGGWWRADGSIFCDGTRYIVDCNLSCDADWPGCQCAGGDCGRRRTACNWFRYGQCNQDIECYGPIVCRMATCEPPYLLDLGCTDETFWDDSTANHSADCPSPGGGGSGEEAQRLDAPEGEEGDGDGGGGDPDRAAEREERSRLRDEERAARQAEREAERAARRAERDAERAAEEE